VIAPVYALASVSPRVEAAAAAAIQAMARREGHARRLPPSQQSERKEFGCGGWAGELIEIVRGGTNTVEAIAQEAGLAKSTTTNYLRLLVEAGSLRTRRMTMVEMGIRKAGWLYLYEPADP
jgi:hypothetical protein